MREGRAAHLFRDVHVEETLGMRLLDHLPRVLCRENNQQTSEVVTITEYWTTHRHGPVMLGSDRDDLVRLLVTVE